MNIVDLLIILIIAITVFLGYRKNLFRNFFDFISLLGAFFISLRFYGPFATKLETLPISRQFINFINENLIQRLSSFDAETRFTLEGFRSLEISESFNFFFEQGNFFENSNQITFTELSKGLLTNVMALVLLFVFSLIIIRFLGQLFERINKMAGLTLVDRFGGVLFSFLKAMIYAGIIAVIVNNLSSFFNAGLLYDLYHESRFATFFFDSGLLDNLFR